MPLHNPPHPSTLPHRVCDKAVRRGTRCPHTMQDARIQSGYLELHTHILQALATCASTGMYFCGFPFWKYCFRILFLYRLDFIIFSSEYRWYFCLCFFCGSLKAGEGLWEGKSVPKGVGSWAQMRDASQKFQGMLLLLQRVVFATVPTHAHASLNVTTYCEGEPRRRHGL